MSGAPSAASEALEPLLRLPGVWGGFACDASGRVLTATMPGQLGDHALTQVALLIVSVLGAGSPVVPEAQRVSFGWEGQRLEVVTQAGGLLCLLMAPSEPSSTIEEHLMPTAEALFGASET